MHSALDMFMLVHYTNLCVVVVVVVVVVVMQPAKMDLYWRR